MQIDRLKKLVENPKYTKKKLCLADGRILSYSECGNITSGFPVLFCFGLMTSSVAIMFAHHVALQNNLRILAVDYPGIGESTPQENRKLEDWAHDMGEFCDKLLGKFSTIRLLGHSLGGLHVLALLTDRTFKARVTRTVLLSPWVNFQQNDDLNPSWLTLARSLPDMFQSSIIPTVIASVSSNSINLIGWSNPQHTQLQAAKIVTSYATLQGNDGNEQMIRLALSKSETRMPKNVRSPIYVYHGAKDTLVLGTSVSELVKRLKERNCPATLISIEHGDHNSVMAEPEQLARVMHSIVGGSSEAWAQETAPQPCRAKSRSAPLYHKSKERLQYDTLHRKGRSLS